METFWKYKFLDRISCVVPGPFAILTIFLLRSWLQIQAQPFDVHAGLKPFIAWLLIFVALTSCYKSIFRFFRRNPQQNDLYTLAQAGIEAERKLSHPSSTAAS